MASKKQEPFRGRPPRKLTKGLKRHLAVVKRQNPAEAEKQRSMIDPSLPPYTSKARSKSKSGGKGAWSPRAKISNLAKKLKRPESHDSAN